MSFEPIGYRLDSPAKRFTPNEIGQAFPPVATTPTATTQVANKHMAAAQSGQFPIADFEAETFGQMVWTHAWRLGEY